MAYTDTLSVVRTAGIGVEIENEVVGSGNNARKSFDLDNGNIIAGSYTLQYGAENSNELTTLTETTHYTLTKDSGLILLTNDGVTELGVNILYATYTHSPKISNTVLESYFPSAEIEVDRKTGNTWGAQTAQVDIFDWNNENRYPTTDEPFMRDYDPKDEIVLTRKGVQTITGFFVLASSTSITNAQTFDSVATSFTDRTDSVNNTGGVGFQPFADTTASGDYFYIGSAYKFMALHTLLYTNGVTAGTNTLEYYNGSSWVQINTTESATGVLNFAASGKVSWSSLQDWQKTSINGSGSLYFVRFVANAVYSTEALINTVYLDQDSVVTRDVPLYQLSYNDDGRVIVPFKLPNGKRNIRVDYLQGYTSTPADVQELTNIIVSIRVFAAITGGSFDDATSFTLGRKTVSIGEVYVNVRETVRQFEERMRELLNVVGPTFAFA